MEFMCSDGLQRIAIGKRLETKFKKDGIKNPTGMAIQMIANDDIGDLIDICCMMKNYVNYFWKK